MGTSIDPGGQRRRRRFEEVHALADAVLGEAEIIGGRSAAGDPARLRGIPMIGGASGAIPGTVPHRQRRLDHWSGRG